jgi:hypothetical protein
LDWPYTKRANSQRWTNEFLLKPFAAAEKPLSLSSHNDSGRITDYLKTWRFSAHA